jgi:hydrogenase maturation protease
VTPRILIAGIGNIFLGDDGFGVAVAQRLAQRSLPDGVRVGDFGIRGMDLVYALLDDYDACIFVDITTRGEPPGTLYLIEPEIATDGAVALDAHGMDPVKVLALARSMGATPTRNFLVACEPASVPDTAADDEIVMELSEPVKMAVDEAVRMVESLVASIGDTLNNEGESNESATFTGVGNVGRGDSVGRQGMA